MRIDCEMHIGKFAGAVYDWMGGEVSAPQLQALMDEYQLDLCILLAPTAEYADNKAIAAVAKQYPRMVPVPLVNPNGPGGGVPELERAVGEWGMKGLKLHPQRHGYEADSGTPLRLMEAAERLGLTVSVHSGDRCCLPWQIGQLARKFPTVPVIMNHMGFRYFVDGAISVARETPNIYLDTVLVSMPGYLRMAVDQVGADRVVYGSDYPIGHPSSMIAAIKAANVGAEAEALIMGDNLARIMKLSA
ncbi:MAG: amidohydrolase family protein [Burkholderiales bacterium]